MEELFYVKSRVLNAQLSTVEPTDKMFCVFCLECQVKMIACGLLELSLDGCFVVERVVAEKAFVNEYSPSARGAKFNHVVDTRLAGQAG